MNKDELIKEIDVELKHYDIEQNAMLNAIENRNSKVLENIDKMQQHQANIGLLIKQLKIFCK